MIRYFVLTLSMFVSLAHSSPTIKAVLAKDQEFRMRSHQRSKDFALNKVAKTNYFPEKHYDINNIVFYHLKWAYGNYKNLQNFTTNSEITGKGSLDLQSYDPVTGRYIYMLTIKPTRISDTSSFLVRKPNPIPLKMRENVTFKINDQSYMYIEGILEIEKNTSNKHILNKKNSHFTLRFDDDGFNTLILSPQDDITVTIEVS